MVNDFRARVRSELRGHVARGGTLPPGATETLEASLAETLRTLKASLPR